jgi:polyisoprenyl-phosphate glycosyltransferase
MNSIQSSKPVDYSVVIPVYNSSQSLEELCERIDAVFSNMKNTYEIILIDDSSIDNSWFVMKRIREKKKEIKIIQLMKNFGQHNAIICGLHYSYGKFIIMMDDDLQNPPEEIPKMIDKISNGFDAVIGVPEIKQDKIFKNIGSFWIRYLNTKIFNKPKTLKLSSFRIITRSLAEEIRILKTPYPYITGMMLSITSKIGNVYVKHESRKYGRSTYNLKKLINLAFNLIINYTSLPLKILTSVGILVSLLSFIMGIYFIAHKILKGSVVPGWTSVVVLLSFFNGILMTILSIIGEYLSRIINEVSNRQQFVIRQKDI